VCLGYQKPKKRIVFLHRPVVGCSTDRLLIFTSPIFFTLISLEKINQNRTKSASKCIIGKLNQLRNYKADLTSKSLIFTKDNSI